MFNKTDFPDFTTEAAFIRERNGPPTLSPEEVADRDAARQELEAMIIAAYERSSTIAATHKAFPTVGLHRIRRIIATKNISLRFPDHATRIQFLQNLKSQLCATCLAQYISGPWHNWEIGKRLSFPEPSGCLHNNKVIAPS